MIDYLIINNGQTPATNVNTYGLVDICPYPLPADYQTPEMLAEMGVFVVHPKYAQTGVARAAREFPQEEIANAIAGIDRRFYIFARIDYKDAFGIRRSTSICMNVDSLGKLQRFVLGTPLGNEPWYFGFANTLNLAS